ncbi:diguanylate cyclase domain-containing protein [Actinospongicola halichondriae]|uniref:GGDEF domain-containing protein n=1 Tax=Actinospongicola halichondriae TaxID=3236844 RepID=UPI003D52A373
MQRPSIPANEPCRLAEVVSLSLLDSEHEERFDRVTRLARRIFDVEVALVTLVDAERQWFLSKSGTDIAETPREDSFCGHALHSDEVLHVADAMTDERFVDNPLVTEDPAIRFYAGQPIHGPGGSRLGTLCLIDSRPRDLTADEAASLRDLAGVVEDEIAATQAGTIDELTGLTNRRGFEFVSRKVLDVCRRTGRHAIVLFMDLDGLKDINDSHGHGAGDRALAQFAEILAETYRASDVIARLGGDEFAVLLTGADVPDPAIDKLRRATRRFNETSDEPFELRVSVGAALFRPESLETLDELLDRADADMYEDKQRS